VLATRHDVRLGLHRLRLKGELAEILPQRNLERRPAEVPGWPVAPTPGAAASLGAGLDCGPPENRWHGWFIRP